MFKKLLNLFKKSLPEGRNFHMQDYRHWGASIQWTNWPTLKVHGFLPRRPSVGDTLTCDFESGAKLKFQFTQIGYCRDPSDMFFGKVRFLRQETPNV